ncbi:hypothetical protein BDZ91DRAFT_758219 [Kalaharituber pfeilii]|nr:hypothetical protein BDZ91DRAFT_758219 [Kalaharituber pfeilii]
MLHAVVGLRGVEVVEGPPGRVLSSACKGRGVNTVQITTLYHTMGAIWLRYMRVGTANTYARHKLSQPGSPKLRTRRFRLEAVRHRATCLPIGQCQSGVNPRFQGIATYDIPCQLPITCFEVGPAYIIDVTPELVASALVHAVNVTEPTGQNDY